jgi:uncharacterized membrane protein
MDELHPVLGTPGDLLRTAILGFAGGLRTMMPFAAESAYLERNGPDIADGGWSIDLLATRQAATLLAIAALLELGLDKTPFIPDRLRPVPLAARIIASGTACALTCLAEGRTSDSGALIGSLGGAVGSLFGYTFRTRLRLPVWLLAFAEDGLAFTLARWAVHH